MDREKFGVEFGEDSYGIIASDEVSASQISSFLSGKPLKDNEVDDDDQDDQVDQDDQNDRQGQFSSKKKPTPQKKDQVQPQQKKKQKELSEEERAALIHKTLYGLEEDDESSDNDEEEEDNENNIDNESDENDNDSTNDDGDEDEKSLEEDTILEISKELVKSGIFQLDEDEDEKDLPSSPEDLLNRFKYEGRRVAADTLEAYISRRGERYRELFDHVFVKGLEPEEFISRAQKIEAVSNIDMKKPENWAKVVRAHMLAQGYDEDYIDNKIQKLTQNGELEDEAIPAQKILLKREQDELSKRAKEEEQKQKQKVQETIEYRNSVNKILSDKLKLKEFDGIPVNEQFAGNILNYLTSEKFKLQNGETLTEFDRDILELKRPQNHEMRVKLAMIMQLLKVDPTLSKIKKKAVSDETNEVFNGLLRKKAVKKEATKKKITNSGW